MSAPKPRDQAPPFRAVIFDMDGVVRRTAGLHVRACPMCSAEERARIDDFRLYQGDVAAALLRLIEDKRMSLVVAGWHGRLVIGHAQVLKALIQSIACPLLLVKAAPREPFRLKVGEEAFED